MWRPILFICIITDAGIRIRSDEKMTWLKGLLSLLVIFTGLSIAVPVRAEGTKNEAVQMERLMTAAQDAEMKRTPEEAGEVVTVFEAGSSVYVMGETASGWYQVSYQGNTGYVREELLKDIEVDLTALELEMDDVETEGKILTEETERVRSEEERSKVWIIVLGLIIGGIFVTGILIGSVSSGRRRRRRHKRDVQSGYMNSRDNY